MLAVANREPQLVRLLLAKGAQVDRVDDRGDTALLKINGGTSIDMIQALCDQGANVNKLNKAGDAVVSRCCRWGYHEALGLLLRNGADPNLRGPASLGASYPAVLAKHSSSERVVRVLKDFAGEQMINIKDCRDDGEMCKFCAKWD